MALLPTLELSPQESLALFYSQHLQLWYLEMGPLIPWLVKISTWWLGHGEMGVRFLAPLLALISCVCLWRLCRGVFDSNTAAWSVVVLQMVPAYNIAAISMTPAIVSVTLLLAFILAFRQALHRSAPWDRMWLISAVLLLLAVLTDWRNSLAYFCALVALWRSERRRHHVLSPGFALVTLGTLIGLGLFLRWNVALDWPSWEAGELEPVWQGWPNLLRWVLLVSPVLLVILLWAIRHTWRQWRRLGHDDILLVSFTLPFAVLDFAWGPRERWPDTGFLLWLVLAIALLMHHNVTVLTMRIQRKIALRSVTLLLAGLQSMMLMRTNMVRSLGIPWALSRSVDAGVPWRTFLWQDPSSGMMGWEISAAPVLGKIIDAAAAQPGADPYFVIARNWQLAVSLEACLPSTTSLYQPTPGHPRVHVVEEPERAHPHSLLPRYDAVADGKSLFSGRHALYVTDLATSATPPPAIRRAFERWKTVSVHRVVNAGQEVRTLKIFACYGYKPPDL